MITKIARKREWMLKKKQMLRLKKEPESIIDFMPYSDMHEVKDDLDILFDMAEVGRRFLKKSK